MERKCNSSDRDTTFHWSGSVLMVGGGGVIWLLCAAVTLTWDLSILAASTVILPWTTVCSLTPAQIAHWPFYLPPGHHLEQLTVHLLC